MTAWEALFEAVGTDRVSGARQIALNAARALLAFSEQEKETSPEEIRWKLVQVARSVLAAQPSMAALFHVLNDAVGLCERLTASSDPIPELLSLAESYIQGIEQSTSQIAGYLVSLLPAAASVVTISRSSVVEAALVSAWEQGKLGRVCCLESRPNLEGRELAAALAEQCPGLRIELLVDAAFGDALSGADRWIVGADSLTDAGVVNKVGTRMLAAVAHTLGVEGCVLSDTTKLWPTALGVVPIELHPESEVWPDAPHGIAIINRYFDLTPWELVPVVITEDGPKTGQDMAALISSGSISPSLADLFV